MRYSVQVVILIRGPLFSDNLDIAVLVYLGVELPSGSLIQWMPMGTRKTQFTNGEFYHVFNRGVDKREVFSDEEDLCRFFQSMDEFNVADPIGSIYENSFKKDSFGSSTPKLVEFVCFCLNLNHYHFILKQVSDNGIQKFMQKLGTGYTNFYNKKYKRSGALFQGRYKTVHVDSNEYLLHLSVYVNLNDKVHRLGSSTPKLSKSSWDEYLQGRGDKNDFCKKDIILDQFNNVNEYKNFAKSSLIDIQERKDMKNLLME